MLARPAQTKPEYRILVGDCFAHMASFRAQSIDMVCADLPYGMTQNSWDTPLPFEPLWQEYRRIAKPNAAIVLLAAQPFASKLVCSNISEFRYDLIWRKNKATGFLNAKKMPLRNHEHILVFYRDLPPYNPQKTQGHKPGNYAHRIKHSTNYGAQTPTEYGGSTERYPLSVQEFPIINNDSPDKEHPTQKPVDLFRWLVRTYTNPGAVVLDNTCGSGTTGVACMLENRHAIMIELNPAYAEIARKRIDSLKT